MYYDKVSVIRSSVFIGVNLNSNDIRFAENNGCSNAAALREKCINVWNVDVINKM